MARRLACIIGYPVAHSLSPAIHNAAFAALGLDWTYVALAVRPGAVAEGVSLLRTLRVDGANVTMPHKQAVVPHLDGLEGDAATLGAVNTIVRDEESLVGHNTDGAGFVAFLRADAGFEPAGTRALILGAGGAARGVALALVRAGSVVTIAGRRAGQATEAAAATGAAPGSWDAPPEADLVVQATPARDGLPLDRLALGPGVIAVDLIYPPPETPFCAAARAAGARAFDGLGMLVRQAALSFELWTGAAPPIGVMAEAARAGLAGVRMSDSPGQGT